MFWRVLLIMFLCAIPVEALLIWLGLIIGELVAEDSGPVQLLHQGLGKLLKGVA